MSSGVFGGQSPGDKSSRLCQWVGGCSLCFDCCVVLHRFRLLFECIDPNFDGVCLVIVLWRGGGRRVISPAVQNGSSRNTKTITSLAIAALLAATKRLSSVFRLGRSKVVMCSA